MPAPPTPAVFDPASPIQFLKGVGPQRAKSLAKLGIHTVADLLRHYPRAHEDRRFVESPSKALPGSSAALKGVVQRFDVAGAGPRLEIGRATLLAAGQTFEALWFRRRSFRYDAFDGLKKKLQPGTELAVFGPVQRGTLGVEVRVEDHEFLDRQALSPHMGRWVPVYDLTEGVDGRWLRGLVRQALDGFAAALTDGLPPAVRAENDLAPFLESLSAYHYPADAAARDRARRALAFEEFFLLELAVAAARRQCAAGPPAPKLAPTRALLSPFRQALGFDFTDAQKRVIHEIFGDMAATAPMRRLLMGEVGSGKTAVALSALLLAVENGWQGAFMAPTEILAEQHALNLARLLKPLPVKWALFTSGRTAAEKRRDKEALAKGEIDIAVGTHALLRDGVTFRKLGLAVIDEQHRFGVAQRAALAQKGAAPHVLLMTATPIPRTLAMTLYGDLSVSVINQLPPGRPGITTHWLREGLAWEGVGRAVKEGRQAYVVFPLVEASEKLDLRAVLDGWKRLKEKVFPGLSVDLLHGRMKSAEKEKAMARFAAGETQVLCATPVIEVGVDIPNAAVMVILNAERFGLAQLHQLRGRVGRGRHASTCYLVSDVTESTAADRLRVLCRTTDGFRLAEEDLRQRGPGEFLGEAQHGLPTLKAGNLVTDAALIEEARSAAFRLLEKDPALKDPDNGPLAGALRERFSRGMAFGRTA